MTLAFRRLCKKVGLVEARFHTLRHTAAGWMAMSGADVHTIAKILRHKDLRMAMRYQHVSSDFLASAVSKLDGVFAAKKAKPEQENEADRHHSVTKLLEAGQQVTVSG